MAVATLLELCMDVAATVKYMKLPLPREAMTTRLVAVACGSASENAIISFSIAALAHLMLRRFYTVCILAKRIF